MKSKINIKLWVDVLFFTLFLFAIELIFRIVEHYTFSSWTILRLGLSSIILSIIWHFFILCFIRKNNKKVKVLSAILLFIVSLYALAQAGFLNFIGIYMSVGTSSQLGAVTSYVKDFIISLRSEYYLIFVPTLIYIIYVFLPNKREFSTNNVKIKYSFFSMTIMLIIFCCLYYSTLVMPFMQNALQQINNIDLFHNPTNSSISVNQFGTTVYAILDIKALFLPYKDDGSLAFADYNLEEEPRKLDDTAWKKLDENTTNTIFKNLNNYFMTRPVVGKNEMTGKFANKNLIVIMMESINTSILNEEYFPNFAKMLKNSWYFENNYSPRNSCATINNEVSGITSLYTINNLCTGNVYKDNQYFESLFNRFKQAGYYVSSYHDYDESFYERPTIHKNLGSENYFGIDKFNFDYVLDNENWPNDEDFINEIVPMFADNDKFFTWITTVSAHHPYNETTLGTKYIDLFEDTDYTESAKHYLSKAKVTDDALGALLEQLKKAGKLDDTVIVLYGDHYPYALSENDLESFMGKEILDNFNRDNTPFLIYNPSLEAKIFSEYTTYINIAPTLANLFNVFYDSRLYLGDDMFDDSFPAKAIYTDGSWEDEIAIYNAASSLITYKDDNITYSTEELKKINSDIASRIRMSNLAITNNYFKYLDEGLQKYQIEKGEYDD